MDQRIRCEIVKPKTKLPDQFVFIECTDSNKRNYNQTTSSDKVPRIK